MLPSEFVLNVSLEKRRRTANGGFNSGHGLAGACLVRLTRTPIVILYAQPKTPINSPRSVSEPGANRIPARAARVGWWMRRDRTTQLDFVIRSLSRRVGILK